MLMNELISTCSHGPVAEAGVISIGPAFYARIARASRREDMRVGTYAARAVRRFQTDAAAADWEELSNLCAGEDMPILRGLHHIVERAMEHGDQESEGWRTFIASLECRQACDDRV
jgi:hypothetical protein